MFHLLRLKIKNVWKHVILVKEWRNWHCSSLLIKCTLRRSLWKASWQYSSNIKNAYAFDNSRNLPNKFKHMPKIYKKLLVAVSFIPVVQLQPVVESGYMPGFVNKVLLAHSYTYTLHIIGGCFWTTRMKLSSWNTHYLAYKAQNIYWLFTEEASWPLYWLM